MITFKCTCGKVLKVADEFAGKPGQCPACGAVVSVPSDQSHKSSEPTEKARISFKCPCGEAMTVKAQFAGKQFRCPSCDQVLVVPDAIPTAKAISTEEPATELREQVVAAGPEPRHVSPPTQPPVGVASPSRRQRRMPARRTVALAAVVLIVAALGMGLIDWSCDGGSQPHPRSSNSEADAMFRKGNQAKDAEGKAHFYTRAIKLDPVYWPAYLERARAFLSMSGMRDSARTDLNKAIALNPNCYDAFLERSRIWSNWSDAIDDCTHAILIDPSRPEGYYQRAVVYRNEAFDRKNSYDAEKFIKKALEECGKTIERDSDYQLVYHELSIIFKSVGQRELSFQNYAKWEELNAGLDEAGRNSRTIEFCNKVSESIGRFWSFIRDSRQHQGKEKTGELRALQECATSIVSLPTAGVDFRVVQFVAEEIVPRYARSYVYAGPDYGTPMHSQDRRCVIRAKYLYESETEIRRSWLELKERLNRECGISIPHLTIWDAAEKGDIEGIRSFATKGVSIDAKGEYGNTPLHVAVANRNATLMRRLLTAGADVNARSGLLSRTPLHQAVCLHPKIVQVLIENGANVHARDVHGNTPLHLAGHDEPGGNTEQSKANTDRIIAILLAKGGKINAKNRDGGTPLHKAAERGFVVCAKVLLARGANIAAKDKDGDTPLHLAVRGGHTEVAKLLIEKGADTAAKGKDGDVPLFLALRRDHRTEAAKLLIKKGADVRVAAEDGSTPLHYVALNGNADVAKLLIEKGADVNAVNKSGLTPLHYAVGNDWYWVTVELVGKGATVNARDKQGRTPLAYRRDKRGGGDNQRISELLRKHGGTAY